MKNLWRALFGRPNPPEPPKAVPTPRSAPDQRPSGEARPVEIGEVSFKMTPTTERALHRHLARTRLLVDAVWKHTARGNDELVAQYKMEMNRRFSDCLKAGFRIPGEVVAGQFTPDAKAIQRMLDKMNRRNHAVRNG